MKIKDAVKKLNEALDDKSKIKYIGVSNKDLEKAFKKAMHSLKKADKLGSIDKSVVEFYEGAKKDKGEKKDKKDKGEKKDKKEKKEKKEKKKKEKGVVRIAVEAYIKNPEITADDVNKAVEKALGKQAKSTVSNVMCVMGHVKEVLGLGKKSE